MLAIAVTFGDSGPAYRVVESHDGGATFAAPIFAADPGDLITGSRSRPPMPNSIDLALAHGSQLVPGGGPQRGRRRDWPLFDLGGALGADQIRILAIDPVDPDRVFLRGIGASGDVLAIFDEATPPMGCR